MNRINLNHYKWVTHKGCDFSDDLKLLKSSKFEDVSVMTFSMAPTNMFDNNIIFSGEQYVEKLSSVHLRYSNLNWIKYTYIYSSITIILQLRGAKRTVSRESFIKVQM